MRRMITKAAIDLSAFMSGDMLLFESSKSVSSQSLSSISPYVSEKSESDLNGAEILEPDTP